MFSRNILPIVLSGAAAACSPVDPQQVSATTQRAFQQISATTQQIHRALVGRDCENDLPTPNESIDAFFLTCKKEVRDILEKNPLWKKLDEKNPSDRNMKAFLLKQVKQIEHEFSQLGTDEKTWLVETKDWKYLLQGGINELGLCLEIIQLTQEVFTLLRELPMNEQIVFITPHRVHKHIYGLLSNLRAMRTRLLSRIKELGERKN